MCEIHVDILHDEQRSIHRTVSGLTEQGMPLTSRIDFRTNDAPGMDYCGSLTYCMPLVRVSMSRSEI